MIKKNKCQTSWRHQRVVIIFCIMIWLWLLWMFVVAAIRWLVVYRLSCLGCFLGFSQAVQNAAYNLQELLPGSMQVHLDPKKMPWEATLYTKKYKIVWIYCFLDPPRGAKWMGRGARFNTTHWRVLVTGLNLIEFVYLMYVLHARIDAYIHACWWGSWIDAPHQFGNPTEDTTYTRKSRPNGMSSFPLSHSHRTCFNLTWYDWRMIKPYMLFCFFLIKHAKHTINTSNI